MRIAVIGGNGQIARLLTTQLIERGHRVTSVIRNPDYVDSLKELGADPVVADLEQSTATDLAKQLGHVDAVVFAAGAGPGSSAERKLTLDRDGAILSADAAEIANVRRFVVVSAIGTDTFDRDSDDVYQVYLRAKSEADADIRARSAKLDWTIVRPGGLTDDEPTGHVKVGEQVERGSIPRADVAAVIAALLVRRVGIHKQFEVVSGDDEVGEAVKNL
ncbi:MULTISPECIES: SDR family oxidoreductase [unclassified Pseudoclavibacter]|uniref:SDR family oxidoreductase n=1 Tax=unclassified Pseudoclavibacter TaxID=2615177 RepID=UPI0012F3199D|nr:MULTISPECIES: SDR family oxidoreductase [unclassified Pseudoclavibacter]MBF4460232.1 SDR family oxidoreductase [Pseudoclavibacter sp. VKM Ac-2867]VXB61670.1 NAD-dependent dehydratase [Pseudoclavibacter sp. 8L]